MENVFFIEFYIYTQISFFFLLNWQLKKTNEKIIFKKKKKKSGVHSRAKKTKCSSEIRSAIQPIERGI